MNWEALTAVPTLRTAAKERSYLIGIGFDEGYHRGSTITITSCYRTFHIREATAFACPVMAWHKPSARALWDNVG